MIKFYKNNKHYAECKGIHRDTASKRIKNGLVEVFEVPKGMKYYEVNKEQIIKEYIESLGK